MGAFARIFRNVFLARNSSLKFIFWFRCCKSNNRVIRTFAKIQRVRLTRKYGVQISEMCTIGPGLELPHCLPIVVHYPLNIFSEIPFYRLSLYISYLQMFSFGLNTHEISLF